MDKNIRDGLEAYLKKSCAPGTPMEIRFMEQPARVVTATGEVVYHEGFPYVTGWGVAYKDPQTKLEGWVMIDYVYFVERDKLPQEVEKVCAAKNAAGRDG